MGNLRFLKGYRTQCVLSPLFKLLEALIELFVPIVMKNIIDIGVNGGGGKSYVLKMGLILVLLGVVGLAFSITAQYFAANAATGYATSLRHSLFKHIQSLSYSEVDSIGTSALTNRMTNDVNQAQNGVNLTLRLLLRSPFVVFGAMIMAFTVDVKAAVPFVVVVPALFVVVFTIMFISVPLFKKIQDKLDRILLSVRENLIGVRVIRAFDKEESEIETFRNRNTELCDMQNKVGMFSAVMNPLTYVIINLGIVAIINYGAVRVNSGSLTQGEVVALVNYMSQILVEVVKLANLIITVTRAIASGKRIDAIFEVTPSVTQVENPVSFNEDYENIIEFNDVALSYHDSGDNALDNIDLKIKKGETVGVIGGTGSGKTSLVNMIPRFYDAFEGSVKFKGVDVKECNLSELREKIGIVPQKAALFKGTIRSNMQWGRQANTNEIIKALTIAQAIDFVKKKENTLDAEVDQEGRNFSGGQKQRLTIARAIIKNPEVLILDDSASALDFATEAALRKALNEELKGVTKIMVSQRTSSIKDADKIVVMDDGRIVDIGTHEQLLDRCGVYQEIHYSQISKEDDIA